MKPALSATLVVLLVAAASAAQAQQRPGPALSGPYVGLGLGVSSYAIGCAQAVTCRKVGPALRFNLGWRFTGGLGLEGVFADLGRAKASDGTTDSTWHSKMSGAALALFVPVSPELELTVRAGAVGVWTRREDSVAGVPTSRVSETRPAPYGALGLSWQLNRVLSLSLDASGSTAALADSRRPIRAVTAGVGLQF